MERDNIEQRLIEDIEANQELANEYLELVAEDQKLLDIYQKHK